MDDQAEAGELRSSLDHGSVPYIEVRRRLVLDERGFASAEISVVTLEPVPGAAEHLIDHRFGDAPRREIRIGGEEVLRIETVPFATLVSIGPGFVMTFQRGQGRSEEWLEQLVEATLHAVALGTRHPGNAAHEGCDLSGIPACRFPVEPVAASAWMRLRAAITDPTPAAPVRSGLKRNRRRGTAFLSKIGRIPRRSTRGPVASPATHGKAQFGP